MLIGRTKSEAGESQESQSGVERLHDEGGTSVQL